MEIMHPNERVKLAMDAYAFGVSAALQELGMTKEAADELAIKEAATPAALKKVMETASKGGKAVKDYAVASPRFNKAVGHTFGTAQAARRAVGSKVDKAKDIASTVSGKVRGAGAAAAEKAMGAGKAVKDVASGAVHGDKYRKPGATKGLSEARIFGEKHRKAIGGGAAGLGALGVGGAAYGATRDKE